ncbi:aminodeoxychorismate/anthranilate synthase component II [Sebaldella sp. S0638]|uniref:anthranilate synthase component II n=1 Tax=Sebaldella sp. S0638 TaxID=2957809 RepID=UPI00209E710F|nr:aminodeoxychorismate/anthranilate synthase component II [Sebaldella sp. S0638]MCP1224926.1 aminodeoxychorismate/anthranilate synthase component II [Sebaldella sp. S0638]
MILLIDNYDSFVFNVKQYIEDISGKSVYTVRNDSITIKDIRELKPSGIILSPGPKHPSDSNICLDILKNISDIPVLGICLGHQAVGYSLSGEINCLDIPVHGKTSNINIIKKEKLFDNIPESFSVMRYHSLYISENNFPEELEILAKTDDGIIMAVKHKTKEIYGVQFHPESYFTDYGKEILKNFISISYNQEENLC